MTDERTSDRNAQNDSLAREILAIGPPGLVDNYLRARMVVALERLAEALMSTRGF